MGGQSSRRRPISTVALELLGFGSQSPEEIALQPSAYILQSDPLITCALPFPDDDDDAFDASLPVLPVPETSVADSPPMSVAPWPPHFNLSTTVSSSPVVQAQFWVTPNIAQLRSAALSYAQPISESLQPHLGSFYASDKLNIYYDGRPVVIRTAVLRLERVAVEKQNIEILVQIGAGRETECVNPPSRGFRGGFNVDKSWSYGDGVACLRPPSHHRPSLENDPGGYRAPIPEDSAYRIAASANPAGFGVKTSSIWDVDSLGCVSGLEHVPTWMNLPAYCWFPSSIRREFGGRYFRAYPGGFPWVEPVSRKVRTVGGIQDVWGGLVVPLELCEILREEVVGGAVGVVQGGFPQEGAQGVRFPEECPNADSCSPNRVIVSCQVPHSHVGARGHTQSVWDPHNTALTHIEAASPRIERDLNW
ncbi:hypothetical protein DFH09DRAFT_1112641 [Mycena vulgaris]|nr:hypothetical protein DFH09DRAFT_1112641 [Mycena vulgaris]